MAGPRDYYDDYRWNYNYNVIIGGFTLILFSADINPVMWTFWKTRTASICEKVVNFLKHIIANIFVNFTC